jgi:hypothetical protein
VGGYVVAGQAAVCGAGAGAAKWYGGVLFLTLQALVKPTAVLFRTLLRSVVVALLRPAVGAY